MPDVVTSAGRSLTLTRRRRIDPHVGEDSARGGGVHRRSCERRAAGALGIQEAGDGDPVRLRHPEALEALHHVVHLARRSRVPTSPARARSKIAERRGPRGGARAVVTAAAAGAQRLAGGLAKLGELDRRGVTRGLGGSSERDEDQQCPGTTHDGERLLPLGCSSPTRAHVG